MKDKYWYKIDFLKQLNHLLNQFLSIFMYGTIYIKFTNNQIQVKNNNKQSVSFFSGQFTKSMIS